MDKNKVGGAFTACGEERRIQVLVGKHKGKGSFNL